MKLNRTKIDGYVNLSLNCAMVIFAIVLFADVVIIIFVR